MLVPLFLLISALLPIGSPSLSFEKVIAGIILLGITLPYVFFFLVGKRKIDIYWPAALFIFAICFNLIVALINDVSIQNWLRYSFGSFIFVGMICIMLSVPTEKQKNLLWYWLIFLSTLASLANIIILYKYGLASAFEDRLLALQQYPFIALMLLYPLLGYIKGNKLLIILMMFIFCMILISGTRTYYIIILVASIYIYIYVLKSKAMRFNLLMAFIIIGAVLVVTPMFGRVYSRFYEAAEMTDRSTLGRVDEVVSVLRDVRENPLYILFGQGYGVRFKVQYYLSGREASAQGFATNNPHNDYVARILYSGLLGLGCQLYLYLMIFKYLRKALKENLPDKISESELIRLHGGMLVLLSMVFSGMAGSVMYYWNVNIFQGCAIGLALSDAQKILSKHKDN